MVPFLVKTMINVSEFKYKYEMHLHTAESSACGKNVAKDMVIAHKRAGYTGIFVTDHAWGGNTRINRNLPYKEWVKEFSQGYYNALCEGDKQELHVFFGWEAGYNGTEFLIYGLTPTWLMDNQKLWDASIEEQYKIIHSAGGFISQAHPYREEAYIPQVRVFPEYVDAIEVDNATHVSPLSLSHKSDVWNKKAWELALSNNKYLTAGSDIHSTNVFGGGVVFKNKYSNSEAIINAIKSEDILLCDGVCYHDKMGNTVENV